MAADLESVHEGLQCARGTPCSRSHLLRALLSNEVHCVPPPPQTHTHPGRAHVGGTVIQAGSRGSDRGRSRETMREWGRGDSQAHWTLAPEAPMDETQDLTNFCWRSHPPQPLSRDWSITKQMAIPQKYPCSRGTQPMIMKEREKESLHQSILYTKHVYLVLTSLDAAVCCFACTSPRGE